MSQIKRKSDIPHRTSWSHKKHGMKLNFISKTNGQTDFRICRAAKKKYKNEMIQSLLEI